MPTNAILARHTHSRIPYSSPFQAQSGQFTSKIAMLSRTHLPRVSMQSRTRPAGNLQTAPARPIPDRPLAGAPAIAIRQTRVLQAARCKQPSLAIMIRAILLHKIIAAANQQHQHPTRPTCLPACHKPSEQYSSVWRQSAL